MGFSLSFLRVASSWYELKTPLLKELTILDKSFEWTINFIKRCWLESVPKYLPPYLPIIEKSCTVLESGELMITRPGGCKRAVERKPLAAERRDELSRELAAQFSY